MFAHDQDRTVAFGDAGDRTLNLPLDRGNRLAGANGFVCRLVLWMTVLSTMKGPGATLLP